MKVYKFGGASVRTADGVRNLKNIIEDQTELFIIVSAMGKTTNALEKVFDCVRENRIDDACCGVDSIATCHQGIIDNLFGESNHHLEAVDNLFADLKNHIRNDKYQSEQAELWYDLVVSYGELVSTTIVSAFLNWSGNSNKWIDMRNCFITQNRHKDANVLIEESAPKLLRAIAASECRIFVGQGFIGSAEDGTTTTLGREGSDYSAAVVANIVGAESMSVWKDVCGILNADPKFFEDAKKIDYLNYTDTIELAYSGAQIIHPKTIKPLQAKNIPLYVRPFGDKTATGSAINATAKPVDMPIIILKKGQTLLRLSSRDFSFVMEERFPIVFSTLERFRIRTNLIHNTAVVLSLCIESSWHIAQLKSALEDEGFDVEVIENVDLLTIRHCTEQARQKYAADTSAYLICQADTTTLRLVKK